MPHDRITTFPSQTIHRVLAGLLVVLLTATAASADTLRIVVDRALVWTSPSGTSVVLTQVSRGQVLEIVRRTDDWYEIVLPERERRTGFIRASQVELVSPASGTTTPPRPPGATQGPATRPAPRVRDPRTFASISAGYRIGGDQFTRSDSAFEDDFAEAGSIDADYGNGSGFEFDVMVGQRIGRQFGAAFGVTAYSRTSPVTIDASVPHPFYFDQPRDVSLEDDEVTGREVGMHASLVWIRSVSPSTRLMIFGGPSFFKVTQNVVTGLVLTSSYPFDEASASRAVTEERDGLSVGFHVGADVTHFFSPSFGLGVSGRFSRGTIEFDDDTADVNGGAGAAQVAGGLRFRF